MNQEVTIYRHSAEPISSLTITVKHLILPGHEHARGTILIGESIREFLVRSNWSFRTPTICVFNGVPLLRASWDTRVTSGDTVAFLSRPWGGGSDNKLLQVGGIIALIALAAFAPWAAAGISAGLGLGLGAAGIAGLQAAIVLGGTILISTFVIPKAGGQTDEPVNQLFSLQAQGNLSKPFETIGIGYGRLKTFPDFAATPWTEFNGNDQYLNVLLSLGCGKFHVQTLYDDLTPFWDANTGLDSNFSNIQVEIYNPGDNVGLFPINVVSSNEVTGQQLPDPAIGGGGGWIGGFIVGAPGTTTTAIAVDLVFPQGLFQQESGEHIAGFAVGIDIEYRPVDNSGVPLASYSSLDSTTYTYATRQPQRITVKKVVDAGRYQVRVKRSASPPTNSSSHTYGADIVWSGLRAFLSGPTTFRTTTIAIRALATNQFTSSHKFGVLWTRILPVWNGSTLAEQPTQNPIWAFYDMAVNTEYGARRPGDKLDFQSVVDQAIAANTRGDTFNFVFSSPVPIPQAFDTALHAARAKHKWSGDVLSLVRDEWNAVPQMLLTDKQIVRNSLNFTYIFNDDDAVDCAIIEYLEEATWAPAEVQYPPNVHLGFQAQQPGRIRIDGITNRDHATREVAFFWLQSSLRRIQVDLSTEHDGRVLGLGSSIRVQSELPQTWGSSGDIIAASSLELTLNPAPVWGGGQCYINIRTKKGRALGPIKVYQGANATLAELDPTDLAAAESAVGVSLANALARMDGAELPTYDFGTGTSISRRLLVLSGKPSGDVVQIQAVVDTIDVHTDDLSSVPGLPAPNPFTTPTDPVIVGAYATYRQNVVEPILDASWWPAAGAISYRADVSYDGRATWTPVFEANSTGFSFVAARTDLVLRIQAIGKRPGPFTYINAVTPTIAIPAKDLAIDIQKTIDTVAPAFKLARAAALALTIAVSPIDKITPIGADPDLSDFMNQAIGSTIQDRINAIAETATEALLNAHEVTKALREASITVDPAGGRVTIWALDQYKTAITQYQSTVQAQFDAVNASILLRATNTQVVDLINTAQLGFATVLDYNFSGAVDNSWTGVSATLTPGVNGLSIAITADGGYAKTPAVSFPAGDNKLLKVSIKRTGGVGWGLKLYWGATFEFSTAFSTPADPTVLSTLVLNTGGLSSWTGTLTHLGLGGDSGTTFELDTFQVGSSSFQTLALLGIETRVSVAEISISALNASVALLATSAVVNSLTSTVTTVQANLSALAGTVALKADTATVTSLSTTITDVSLTLNSVKGSISFGIDTSRETPTQKAAAESNIEALLNDYQGTQHALVQLASIRQVLSAKVDSLGTATALSFYQQGVRVDDVIASVTNEIFTRANAISALAQTLTTVSARVDTTVADVQQEILTRTTADTALSQLISTLTSTVTSNATTATASIQTEAVARVIGDAVLASSITALSAVVDFNGVTFDANIATEITARINADGVIATSVTTLSAYVDTVLTYTQALVNIEFIARVNEDGVLAAALTSVSTTVGNHTASILNFMTSVNGVAVELGLIGTIDGITGGLIISGFKNAAGSVIYNILIQGNVIVDGSITTQKIAALQITAALMAVGSIWASSIIADNVVITGHLVADAATKLEVTEAGLKTIIMNGNPQVLVTKTIVVPAGGCTGIITSAVDMDKDWGAQPNGTSITNFNLPFQLQINNVTVCVFYGFANFYQINSANASLRTTGHFEGSRVISLAPGTYTIRVLIVPANLGGIGGTPTADANQSIVSFLQRYR